MTLSELREDFENYKIRNCDDTLSRFDTIPERDGQTDGQTIPISGMVKTATSQNDDRNLLQMMKLLKRCATVTFIKCFVTESALNITNLANVWK